MKKWNLNFWMPFLLGAIAFGAVAVTIRDPGLTWDESIYFGFSQRYWVWASELGRKDWYDLPEIPAQFHEVFRNVPRPWGPFSAPVVHLVWRMGQDHPPLALLCYAAGLGLFYPHRDAIAAFRLPAAFMFAGMVLATYFLFSWALGGAGTGEAERQGPPQRRVWVGAAAAASLLLMPRVFGHAHFGALDMPVTLMWLLTVIAFRNGMGSRPWAVVSGILFGLALLTKINAILLPLALWPWGLLAHGRKSVWAILSMLILGPLVFIAGWPAMWYYTWIFLKAYLSNKLGGRTTAVYYLGKCYGEIHAPWHYPFVLTAVTVPLGLLVAFGIGLGRALRQIRAHSFCFLVLMNLLVIYGVAAFPGTPKYDGIRLFLPAFPFVAGLAGMGIEYGWRRLAARFPQRRLLLGAAGVLFALVLLRAGLSYHPYELSFYSGLVGGLRGAHRLGFETQYWGDVFTPQVMRKVNELCPKDSSVHVTPWDIHCVQLLQAVGELRADLRFVTDIESADYIVLLVREAAFTEKERELYQRGKPVWELRLKGVPLCMIFFARPGPH